MWRQHIAGRWLDKSFDKSRVRLTAEAKTFIWKNSAGATSCLQTLLLLILQFYLLLILSIKTMTNWVHQCSFIKGWRLDKTKFHVRKQNMGPNNLSFSFRFRGKCNSLNEDWAKIYDHFSSRIKTRWTYDMIYLFFFFTFSSDVLFLTLSHTPVSRVLNAQMSHTRMLTSQKNSELK